MFFKLVHYRVSEKQREVFLMSVFEDQIPKWENSLEPADDIKAPDRTFKLIKDRLLKAVIEKSKKLLSVDDDIDGLDSQDEELQEEEDSEELLSSFHPIKKKNRQELASSDEEEYATYEKRFEDHTKKQMKKLREAGVSIDGLVLAPPSTKKQGKYLAKTDELNKELDTINKSVNHRVRSKQQSEMEKEEKMKSEEQQKRLKAKQIQNQEYARAVKALSLGITFLKYGAIGQPKTRHVFLQENGKKLCWKEPGGAASKKSRCIILKEINQITEGRDTKKFKRFKSESAQQVALSFSLHTKKRTLDLEASCLEEKNNFLQHLRTLLDKGQLASSSP